MTLIFAPLRVSSANETRMLDSFGAMFPPPMVRFGFFVNL
jgi:hypothetical protein